MALRISSGVQAVQNAAGNFASKTITFTNASGAGAVNTNATVFTVSGGLIVVKYIAGRVTTNLTGTNSTIQLGTTSQLNAFIGATTATTLTTTAELWVSTTATQGLLALPAAVKDILIDENILIRSLTAGTTGGVLEIDCVWVPITAGATLV